MKKKIDLLLLNQFDGIWRNLKILMSKWLLFLQCESSICKICSYSMSVPNLVFYVFFYSKLKNTCTIFPKCFIKGILEHSIILWSTVVLSSLATIGGSSFGTRPWLKYDDKLCDFLLDFAFLQWCCHTLEGKVEWPILSASRFWISSF